MRICSRSVILHTIRLRKFPLSACFFSSQDHYKTLGVSREATLEEIKSRFIQLSKEFHPDRNSSAGSSEKFAEISTAYKTLTNLRKRSEHDEKLDMSRDPYNLESRNIDTSAYRNVHPNFKPQRNRLDWYTQHYDDAHVLAREDELRSAALDKQLRAQTRSYLFWTGVKLGGFVGIFGAYYWTGNFWVLGLSVLYASFFPLRAKAL